MNTGRGTNPRLDALRAELNDATRASARKAVRELVPLMDDAEAVALAAAYEPTAGLASETLLRLWSQSPDPDVFSAVLLAPAFAREGREELRLSRCASLVGLRHLTMLRRLELRSKKVTDITEIGALTGLTDLDLEGCSKIEDAAPLSALAGLVHLNLVQCRFVTDTKALLPLHRLRTLDLSLSGATSVEGFGSAFPALETLNLAGCRGLQSVEGLSGLRQLTRLDLARTPIADLAGLGDLPSVTHLDVTKCTQLRSLHGVEGMTELHRLEMTECSRLETLSGLGAHPHLNLLWIRGCTSLRNLEGLAPLTGLKLLHVERCHRLTTLAGIGTRSLERLSLSTCDALQDFSELSALTSVDFLTLNQLPEVDDLAPLDVVPRLKHLSLGRLPGLTGLESLGDHAELHRIDVGVCDNLRSLGTLTDLPALRTLRLKSLPSLTDLGDLSGLTNLHTFELSDSSIETLDGVAGTPVEKAEFLRLPNVASLRPLDKCPQLRDLKVEGCALVEDLPAAPLTRLTLGYLKWKDLSPLTDLTGLDHLSINGGPPLTDLGALGTLPSLRDLKLSQLRQAQNIEALLNAPALEKLSVRGSVGHDGDRFGIVADRLRKRGVEVTVV
ncbi:leucine-rich repeat domain-containing protein [Streptomyces xiaopingdaonensis]|uniref:leucine-rich repeat domain-containing protein n=1 Tax=Streptomyces xiaopingdaonensis TaxID=1565415 RepID=UPI00031E07C8|nr:hypothetical protein [Streptomyces xiaopingdaonensis]